MNEQYPNTSEKRKPKTQRAQLKHVLLDVDFFDKPTIRALGFRHTQTSVLLFIRWMMLMSRASNGCVTRDALASVAFEVLQEGQDFETILNYCVEKQMIFEEVSGLFTNHRVIKDQESRAVKIEQSNERQKKYRERKSGASNALQTRLPDTDTDIKLDININYNKELSEPLELPPQLESPEMRQALALWQKRCIENGRPLTQATLEAQMMQLATEPIRLRNAFIFSASLSKCFNLREPPEEQKGTMPVKVNKSFDKAMELLAKERNGKRAGNTSNGDDRSGVSKLSDERGKVGALGKYPK